MFNAKGHFVRKAVEMYIEKNAADGKLESFYSEAVSRALSMPDDLVFIELTELVREEVLGLKYEIRTLPELDIVKIVDDYTEFIDTEIESDDGTFEVTYANIFPLYYITDEYKKFVNDKWLSTLYEKKNSP